MVSSQGQELEPGRQSRRSSDTKVPSDGLSDGSTDDAQRSRVQSKSSDFSKYGLEAFAATKAKRENWCDVRDDDDSDDQELWLSASPFGKVDSIDSNSASPASPATPSGRSKRTARRRRRSIGEEGPGPSKPLEQAAQHTQLPGSVVTIADIGLPCGSASPPPRQGHPCPAVEASPWQGIMSTSPIEQPRAQPIYLPPGALGVAPAPCGSPMNGGSVATIMPVGSPTGDASTRTLLPQTPTIMPVGSMTPMGSPMAAQVAIDMSRQPAPAPWPPVDAAGYQCQWSPAGQAWAPDPNAHWPGMAPPHWAPGVPQPAPYLVMGHETMPQGMYAPGMAGPMPMVHQEGYE